MYITCYLCFLRFVCPVFCDLSDVFFDNVDLASKNKIMNNN